MDYAVVIHPADEGGYWAEVPALPGCYGQGETMEEVLEDTRQAIVSRIEALREDGQPVPTESGLVVTTITLPAA
ncbi:MAG: type II toxin-antitoxin system HicB family antitoxin [Chloroflexota bacterium]|nr:MAG: type II toxin-antitoxin system HicB family antitoxin [Chloroflexota bacterium]